MIRFQVCGTVRLTADSGAELHSVLAQPKQTAVLAYLATRLSRGFQRRDSLLALFWPELDSEHARSALSKAVHSLRRELGEEVLVSRGDAEIGLDANRFWCDVPAIEAALERRQLAEALDLYEGGLLDGFHLSKAPQFDQWLERERAALRDKMVRAALGLTDAASANNDYASAAAWARRATAISPYDESAVRQLLIALDLNGDRAGALKAFDDFARMLAAELETEPAPETVETAQRIRAGRPGLQRPEASDTPQQSTPAREGRAPEHAVPDSHGHVAAWKWVAAGALGVVVVSAALFASRAPASDPLVGSLPRLAVLPFENIGAPEDSLFAEGVSDGIATKLSGLSSLAVLPPQSVARYKNTSKTNVAIGRELGVKYLLLGRVRWQRSPDGVRRVRVSPHLIEVADDRQLWADDFDEELNDVFDVQRQIAARVASELGISLLSRERRAVARRPTGHLGAYEQIVIGNQALRTNWPTAAGMKDAVAAFEKAVALDSNSASAHAKLSLAIGGVRWSNLSSIPRESLLVRQLAHAERAMALDPSLPDSRVAMGMYHYWGQADYARALAEFKIASAAEPNNSFYINAEGAIYKRTGDFAHAAERFARAADLDPLSFSPALEAGYMYAIMRNYEEAQRYLERYAPLFGNFSPVAWVQLARHGDARAVRTWIDSALGPAGFAKLISQAAHGYSSPDKGRTLVRVLCGECDVSIPLVPSLRKDDWQRMWGIGHLHLAAGRRRVALSYYDSARVFQTAQRGPRFVEYILIGRKDEALETARQRVDQAREAGDVYAETVAMRLLAEAYVLAGEHDAAIEQLDWLLSHPSFISIPLLKIDPLWNPLRGHPRFQTLLDKFDAASLR